MHELDVRRVLAETGQEADTCVAEPEPARGTVAGGACELDDRLGGGPVVDVDRELERRAEFGVEVCQAGHAELGKLVGGRLRHIATAKAPAAGADVEQT